MPIVDKFHGVFVDDLLAEKFDFIVDEPQFGEDGDDDFGNVFGEKDVMTEDEGGTKRTTRAPPSCTLTASSALRFAPIATH